MQVVQIVGPSFSGSTALGYALNTAQPVFFASELWRFLNRHNIDSNFRAPPKCDRCGDDCEYWTEELRNHLFYMDTSCLNEVYSVFRKYNPSVSILVDGSKLHKYYIGSSADHRIVVAKHPIKILASHIYNKRRNLGINSDKYKNFQSDVSGSIDKIEEFSVNIMRQLIKFYNVAPLNSCYVQIDRAHRENFKKFREIESWLSLNQKSISPTRFSETPCHAIGGNRAPAWIANKPNKISEADRPRWSFYTGQNELGDWVVDEKYQQLLPDTLVRRICSNEQYQQACYILGYDCYSFD